MKTKIIILTIFLASNVLAGGDDRDTGVVESLESLVPIADQIVPGNQEAHSITLTKDEEVIEYTDNVVAVITYQDCKDTLGLSIANIERFKAFQRQDYRYKCTAAQQSLNFK